jgi:WD40 repeat protein
MFLSYRRFFLAIVFGVFFSGPSLILAQFQHRDGRAEVVCETLAKKHTHIYSAAIDKVGNTLVTAGQGPSIQIWRTFSVMKKREVLEINLDEPVRTIAFAKKEGASVLISGDLRDNIRLWDPATGKALASWRAKGTIYDIAFSARDKILVSSGVEPGARPYVQIWNLQTQKEIKSFSAGFIDSIAFSSDGKLLALANKNGELHVLAYPALKTAWKADKEIRGGGHSVDFAPNGRTIITPGWEWLTKPQSTSLIRFWDTDSGALLGKIAVHPAEKSLRTNREPEEIRWGIRFAKYSPSGLFVASGGYDGKVFLCEVATKQIVAAIPLGRTRLSAIVFYDGDDKFVATGLDGEVFFCDLGKIKAPYRKSDDRNLTEKLEAHWDHLQSGDHLKAVVAVEFFLKHSQEGFPVLRQNLQNEKKPTPASLSKAIGDLTSSVISIRENAVKELEKNLYHAEALLKETLKTPKDLEQRRRIEQILEKSPKLDNLRPEELRPLRVISILERIPTMDSRDTLDWLAKHGITEHVKNEAARSLRNLDP